jgi:hypothetical protein
MEPSSFIISDGLEDLVYLIQKNIYTDAVCRWCEAVLLMPYDLSDLETTTIQTYIDRCKETSK